MAQTRPNPIDDGERAELERLRAEVVRLQSATEGAGEDPATPAPRRHRLRTVGAVVLIVLGCVLAPLSAASVWVSTQVTNTDAYVETVAPLIEDPALQKAFANAVTTEVFRRLDIKGTAEEVLQTVADRTDLPPLIEDRLLGLAVPLSDGVQSFVADQVNSMVASEDFKTLWVEANRTAHQELVATLTGERQGAVQVTDGTVSVNIAPFVQLVKQRLIDRGFSVAERIPDVQASFVVLQSADLAKAQRLFSVLDTLGTIFPFIVLAVLGGGVLLAVDRRRALVGAGLGLALAMLVLAVVIALVRARYLAAVPPDVLPRGAATTLFDTIVRFLRSTLRTALLLGLVVALAAWVAGPSGAAVWTRRAVGRGVDAVRGLGGGSAGLAGSGVGRLVRTVRRPLQVVTVVVAGLVLVFWDQPTPAVLVGILLVVLLVLAVIELLGSREVGASPQPGAEGAVLEGSTAEADQASEPPVAEDSGDVSADPQSASRASR
jgi:hypothetical protein